MGPPTEDMVRRTGGSCREEEAVEVLASSSPTSWVMPAYSMSWVIAAVERLDMEGEREVKGGGVVPRGSVGVWSEREREQHGMA